MIFVVVINEIIIHVFLKKVIHMRKKNMIFLYFCAEFSTIIVISSLIRIHNVLCYTRISLFILYLAWVPKTCR